MNTGLEEVRASDLLKRLKTAVQERDPDLIEKYCQEVQSITFAEEPRCTSSRKRYNLEAEGVVSYISFPAYSEWDFTGLLGIYILTDTN